MIHFLIGLVISFFSVFAFAEKPVVCTGDDGDDTMFSVKFVRDAGGKTEAQIKENWGGGEELDVDYVPVTVLSTKSFPPRYIYRQEADGKNKMVKGFWLSRVGGRKNGNTLQMKQIPSGRAKKPIEIEVSCK